ncbi:MAG: single-stranded DNA-binding protein [Thermoleophilaceae bacterium]|nr:single-stranded DNA-binding protein [Thermoleophilaceae bacterium]
MNINRVIVTGNLTRDPELNTLPSGATVCDLRLAVNGRRKDQSGAWVDKPNFFNVKVWGPQGDNCAKFLQKGRAVAIDGRLDWREWEDQTGNKRQTIDIIADTVQFLGSRDGAGQGGDGNGFAPSADVPVDRSDFQAASVSSAAEDDIPF